MEKTKGVVARLVRGEKVGELFVGPLQVPDDNKSVGALLKLLEWIVVILLLLGSVVNIHNGLKEVSFCFSGIIFAFF